MVRAQGGEDLRAVLRDVPDAQRAERQEPDKADRPEQLADDRRAALLDQEQPDQHNQRDRQDEGLDAPLRARG